MPEDQATLTGVSITSIGEISKYQYGSGQSMIEWKNGDTITIDNSITASASSISFADDTYLIVYNSKNQEEYRIPLKDLYLMHKQWKSGELVGNVIEIKEWGFGIMNTQIWSVSGVLSIVLISMVGAWLIRKFTLRRVVRWFVNLIYRPAKQKVADIEKALKEEGL